MMNAVVTLPRVSAVGVNQSSVTSAPIQVICCPRCEYKFKRAVMTNTVERVVDRQPRSVEDVLKMFDLRPKEMTVAKFLAEGLALREIAVEMNTSEGVVKQYVRIVYQRTGTHRRQGFRMKIDQLRYQA